MKIYIIKPKTEQSNLLMDYASGTKDLKVQPYIALESSNNCFKTQYYYNTEDVYDVFLNRDDCEVLKEYTLEELISGVKTQVEETQVETKELHYNNGDVLNFLINNRLKSVNIETL